MSIKFTLYSAHYNSTEQKKKIIFTKKKKREGKKKEKVGKSFNGKKL